MDPRFIEVVLRLIDGAPLCEADKDQLRAELAALAPAPAEPAPVA